MTGKQLKEFAAKVGDESVIEVREKYFGAWSSTFTIHATIAVEAHEEKKEVEA